MFDTHITENTSIVSPSFKFLNMNGLIVLNCHLDSKGPNILNKETETSEEKRVITFFSNNLASLGDSIENVDVIVGDTNVTVSKSSNKEQLSRDTLLEYILKGITAKYDPDPNESDITKKKKSWILITSSTKINKIRSGFLLLNNQMYKANNPETIEEDGTIIAIRIDNTKLDLLADNYCNLNFGKKWHVCYKNIANDLYTHLPSNSPTVDQDVNFLDFTNPIMDANAMPNDTIFIDHSVVAVSKNALFELTNISPPEPETIKWKNLVVLNLGSIINSNNPWKLNLLQGEDTLSKIEKADSWLFSKMLSHLTYNSPRSEISEYSKYNGSMFGELPFRKGMIDDFAKAMSTVHLYLENEIPTIFPKIQLPSKGGYHKTKKFKTRKIKKYKTRKIKTKKRKMKNKINTRKMNKRKTYKY